MAEPALDRKQEPNERRPAGLRIAESRAHDLVSGSELRMASLPSQWFHGYRRGEIDDLLARAAASLDELALAGERMNTSLEQARSARPASEEAIAQMLSTAARLVEATKEEARREATELVGQAQTEVDRASQLHIEAEALLDAARVEAEGILAAGRQEAVAMIDAARAAAEAAASEAETDRARVIADSTREAAEARAALEHENAQIEALFDHMRETWANRISNALAQLDAADPGVLPRRVPEQEPVSAAAPSPAEPDLAVELSARVGGRNVQAQHADNS